MSLFCHCVRFAYLTEVEYRRHLSNIKIKHIFILSLRSICTIFATFYVAGLVFAGCGVSMINERLNVFIYG